MKIALHLAQASEFSRSFLSVLANGDTPVLLPNFQPGTLKAFAREYDRLETCGRPPIEFSLRDLKSDSEVILFTSGSSGEPKKIVKQVGHLLNEVQVLDGILSQSPQEAVVYASVSHQHIYGLLFSVLWPLYSQRTMGSFLLTFPEQLSALDEAHNHYIVISSPSFLARLDENLKGGRNCRMVTSSGGPLSMEVATRAASCLQVWPYEFFGSSETGGVAWRTQKDGNNHWDVLPGVTVEPVDQGLKVQSDFFSDASLQMADDVEMLGTRKFRHRGRTDRIAKVEGKRVSLSEMESHVKELPIVADVAAIGLTTYREQIGCAVQLSAEGQSVLAEKGVLEVKRLIKLQLSQYFEPVTLPKLIRFVEAVPKNSQGKVEYNQVVSLFSRTTVPTILEANVTQDEAVVSLIAKKELAYFQGHFSGFSLLPGVAQLNWAIAYAESYLGLPGRFQELEVIKFVRPIPPDCQVKLSLKVDRQSHRLEFKYQSGNDVHSSGRVRFGGPDVGV